MLPDTYATLARRHSGPHANPNPSRTALAILTALRPGTALYVRQLAHRTDLDYSSVARTLAVLDRYGLVTRTVEDEQTARRDGHAPRHYWALTDTGREVADTWGVS